jgi:hypothetical protein
MQEQQQHLGDSAKENEDDKVKNGAISTQKQTTTATQQRQQQYVRKIHTKQTKYTISRVLDRHGPSVTKDAMILQTNEVGRPKIIMEKCDGNRRSREEWIRRKLVHCPQPHPINLIPASPVQMRKRRMNAKDAKMNGIENQQVKKKKYFHI